MESTQIVESPKILKTLLLPEGEAVMEIYADAGSTPRSRYKNTTDQGENVSLTTGFNRPLDSNGKYIPWGADNKFPQNLMLINSRNPVSNGLINTKADFAAGRELYLYKKIIDGDKVIKEPIRDNEIEDSLEENEFKHQLNKWTYDYTLLGNFFNQTVRSKSKNKISKIYHQDPNLLRVGEVDHGKVLDYLMADWVFQGASKGQRIPNYNRENPFASSHSIIHVKNYQPGSYYYGMPDWIGAENFIRLLNEIPVWHLSGLKNGYNIRWHIELPASYFDKFPKEDRADEENRLRDSMNDFLAGTENNAKALVTKFFTDSNGKPLPGVKVTPLKSELYDGAFTDLFNQGMVAVCSAHSINPALAGVILNGALSSGSELRNAYNVYLQLKVPRFRDAITQPFYDLKRANKWNKEAHLGLIGHQITSLDENHEGAKEVMM